MSDLDVNVAIIGSGPAGIAAASALSHAGIKDVVVYERETEIGGIPRHTHHPSFGLLVFKRLYSGPRFIRALVQRCPDVRFETNTTLIRIAPGGELEIATPSGVCSIRARHIILATGARETPRHGRLVPGLRPRGIMTTGAMQQFIYSARLRPFERPVIVGTELASFSALWTLRGVGIKPVAMIEAKSRITAYRPSTLFARLLGVPIHYDAAITDIAEIETLKQITIGTRDGSSATIACDGLIFSGGFVGENAVAGASHLGLSSIGRIPLVDQNWITSDPAISAIGNAVHPADTGDQCYLEGLKAGEFVAKLLVGHPTPKQDFLMVRHGAGIKMTTPGIVRPDKSQGTGFELNFHVTAPFTGTIRVSQGEHILREKKNRRCLPARRITMRNIELQPQIVDDNQPIDVTLLGQD